MLYGAIAGDIAGSTFEFYGMKGDEQELFPKGSEFTDDTILTLAVADSLNSEAGMARCSLHGLNREKERLLIIVSVTEVQCAFLLVPGLLIH